MGKANQDLSQSMEEYLEAIYIVSRNKKTVRVKDLVSSLSVSSPSVIRALKRLKENGMVNHEHYGYIELTPKGLKCAEAIYEKHQVLYQFLTEILFVDSKIAEVDACMMEHHVSNETLQKMIRFIGYIKTNMSDSFKDHGGLKKFLENKKEDTRNS
jgi:DtxR family Mn-dependent transcriptional regulator